MTFQTLVILFSVSLALMPFDLKQKSPIEARGFNPASQVVRLLGASPSDTTSHQDSLRFYPSRFDSLRTATPDSLSPTSGSETH
jgi:hypothetical protein